GDAEETFPQADRFEMRDLRAGSAQAALQIADNIQQERIEVNGIGGADLDAAVEPAQLGLALGVDVVIDVQDLAAEVAALIEQLDEGHEALAGLRRYAQHRRAGILGLHQALDLPNRGGRHLVNAVEQDRIGLFKLLAEDVRRL